MLAGDLTVVVDERFHGYRQVVNDRLIVRGAREHNLKDVNLDLPRDALIVFTGLSGSGKSSLAFDTIFAEGQRRYVESLSAYARQFLGQMDKPDVDFIEGLSPAVSIDQKSTSPQPALDGRHDHRGLRLPAAAVRPHRQAALPGLRRADHQADAAADRRPHPRDARGHPLPGARAGDPRAQGRVRRPVRRPADQGLRAGPGRRGRPLAHRAAEAEEAGEAHHRGGRRPAGREAVSKQRITDSVETALGLAGGWSSSTSSTWTRRRAPRAALLRAAGLPQRPPAGHRRARAAVVLVQRPVRRLPGLHRPGHPQGGRPRAGRPRPRARPLAEGAIAPWAAGQTSEYFLRLLQGVADAEGFDLDTPWEQLPARAQKAVLHGTGEQVHVSYRNRYGRDRSYYANYEGVVPWIERRYAETDSDYSREKYEGSCARCRARPARAPGSSPRSSRSPSAVDPSPSSPSSRSATPPTPCATSSSATATCSSPSGCSRRSTPASASSSTSACTTCRSTGRPRRWPAARRSASGWPPRSAPAWSACSTSWTSRRSACTSATTTGSSRRSSG